MRVPKLKPEELESRHREIVDAARRCFLRNGFHQTTTDDICHEASITPGGLYHYFRSKDEVIAAVIQASAHEAVQRLSALADDAANTRSSIRALAGSFTDTMRGSEIDGFTRLDVDVWAESLRNEKLAEITKEGWAVRRDWLRGLIVNAIDEGVYASDVDPTGLANLIMSIWIGLRMGRLLWGDDFNAEETMKALFLMHSGRLVPQRRLQSLRPQADEAPKPRKSAVASA
jgi:AcrR family transcriptional regulator